MHVKLVLQFLFFWTKDEIIIAIFSAAEVNYVLTLEALDFSHGFIIIFKHTFGT
jgi:hypothetical protein